MRWLLPLILLAGCCPKPEPIIVPQEVKVPVKVSCVEADFPEAPDYSDTDAALVSLPDAAARYQLMAIGRNERIKRLNELEVVVKGCRL